MSNASGPVASGGAKVILLKTLVGSRMHGVHNEDSDHDYRAMLITPLGEVLSSRSMKFTFDDSPSNTTFYEANHFIILAAQGNPTILETIYGPKVYECDRYTMLGIDWAKIINTKSSMMQARGMASAMVGDYLSSRWPLEGDMNKKVGKKLSSALLALNSAILLSKTGDRVVSEPGDANHDQLMVTVTHARSGYAPGCDRAVRMIRTLEAEALEIANADLGVTDQEYLHDILCRIYTGYPRENIMRRTSW